jgi:hypothetical protein
VGKVICGACQKPTKSFTQRKCLVGYWSIHHRDGYHPLPLSLSQGSSALGAEPSRPSKPVLSEVEGSLFSARDYNE